MKKTFTVYDVEIEFFDQSDSKMRQVVIVLDDIKGMFIRKVSETEDYFVVITSFGYVVINEKDWLDIKNALIMYNSNLKPILD
mgnify:FL=1